MKGRDRFRIIKTLCLVALVSGSAASHAAATDTPNIILILVDDLGYGDIAAYNEQSKIKTPHLDKLAAQGMRFSDAHAAGSTCVPSRYGLLTGRYPVRAKLDWKSGPVIENDQVTIASYLSGVGYSTAMIGKWHQGLEPVQENLAFDFSEPLQGGPLDRGFDTFFGIHASLDIPPYFYIRGRTATAIPTETINAGSSEGHADGWNHIQGAFWREGLRADDFDLEQVTPRLLAEAVQVLRSHAGKQEKNPLFLYLALPSPHTPWLPSEEFRGQSGAGLYGDFVMQVDAAVGEILDELDSAGMAGDTMVIFSSDNGPVWYDHNTEHFGHDSAGNLRGMKGDGWEGGHRIPLIVRWPGRVTESSDSDQLVSLVDIMATIADVTATTLPPLAGPDSISFYPELSSEEKAGRRTQLLHDRKVIRDGKWKLMLYLGSGGFTRPKFIEPETGSLLRGQLYNLEDDPSESNNLYAVHPGIVARLSAELEASLNKRRSP